MIAIIDYETGNIGSVQKMFHRLGIDSVPTNDPTIVSEANRIVLPGVGAFDAAVKALAETGLLPILEKKSLHGDTPLLGICIGMHLLFEGSEEGTLPGLGWLKGTGRRFQVEDAGLRVPHMGWNTVTPVPGSPLFAQLDSAARFYFVHSYRITCDPELYMATTDYGTPFPCAVVKNNIMGVQFHPEKSHKYGMQLLKNFAEAEL